MNTDFVERQTRSFFFGPFVFIPERQLLLRGDVSVRLGGRAMAILNALIEQPGKIVGRQELIARVWPNTIVGEENLKVNVATLRRALEDGTDRNSYIATVSGRGYRFVAPVYIKDLPASPSSLSTVPNRKHNLPVAATQIFGRDEAIDDIGADLGNFRLVSIIGTGGIGKTTVAVAIADKVVETFSDGVWLVDLSPLRDEALVPNAIATAIGLTAKSTNMFSALCDFLRHRNMLLLLDNCEHLIDAVAHCASRILGEAGGVKILVTSRESLRVKGERVRKLPALSAPPDAPALSASEALAFSAVQLFVDRATESVESFTLTDEDAPLAADICRQLDGLPLAIELAAMRVEGFGVSGLLAQLDNRFRLLVGSRVGADRHRTLEATLDWSYGLLPSDEAALFRAVSVLAGVFDLEAAAAVSKLSSSQAADMLGRLAAKSLINIDLDSNWVAYRLLETTRAYGREQLAACGEDDDVRQRHADYVRKALDHASSQWEVLPAREWGATYIRHIDDLRAALAWAGRSEFDQSLRIRLTVAGLLLWNHLSLTEECRVQVENAIRHVEGAGLSCSAFEMRLQAWYGGSAMFTRGLMPSALDAMRRAMDIAVSIGDIDCHVRSLRLIGVYQLFAGENDEAIRVLEMFASLAVSKFPAAALEAEVALGIGELFVGRMQSVRQRFERRHALDLNNISRSSGIWHHVRYFSDRIVDVTYVLAHALWLTGSPEAALEKARLAVEYASRSGHALSLTNALSWGCHVFFWTGCYEECDQHVSMLEEEVNNHGFELRRPVVDLYRAAVACAQSGIPTNEELGRLEAAVSELHTTGQLARMPHYLGLLADFLRKAGKVELAGGKIDTAIDRAREKNDSWSLPELFRIRALISSAKGHNADAELQLADAMDSAGEMGALSWRLRAAVDLARLLQARGESVRAHLMLSSVLEQFDEGFQTSDLLEAVTLLDAIRDRGGVRHAAENRDIRI